MENESNRDELGVSAEVPAKTRRWSPFVRLALLAVFISTLPFTWGQTSSCNGPSRTFTGIEQATKSTSDTISFIVIFMTPVLLGFFLYLARAAWVRLGLELIAGMFASLGTLYCFLSAAIAGDITHKSSRVYPAPWVATVAIFLIMVDTLRGAAKEAKTLWQKSRARRGDASIAPTKLE